jgi:hypothetical protein
MLRQNRYKENDFVCSFKELKVIQDEITVSEVHNIVIALEPDQVEKSGELQMFIMEIVRAIPKLDNETQDYYETISDDTDFPHSLSVIRFEGNEAVLDYWSDEENNQFPVTFYFESGGWILKDWNNTGVPLDWRKFNDSVTCAGKRKE